MIEYSNIQISEAADVTEPVTLQEVKDWLNVDFADHDDLLTSMITGARQSIENLLNWALVPKTITLDIETSKSEGVRLPYAKAVEDFTLQSVDEDGDTETLTESEDYHLRGAGVRYLNGAYAASYTTVPGTIPEALKEAIKMEVAERYSKRGENESVNGLSEAAKAKAQPYAIVWL